MARAKGYQGIVALKKATTWGTAVAGAALSGVYVSSLSTPGDTQLVDNPVITGNVTMRVAALGNRQVSVTLKSPLRYEGLETAIALIMGTAGVPATVDTSGRQHDLKLANTIDGIFATLAYEIIKDTTIIEIPGVKWNKATLTAKQGALVEIELGGIGDDYQPASAVNTTTTIDTVTLSANEIYAVFKECSLQMNAQTGGALSGTDAVACEGITVTVERQMEPRVTTRRGDKTDEPIESGFAKVTGSLEFAFLETGADGNSGFMADQLAGTAKKAKLLVTSTVLAGSATVFFQHVLWMPNIQFEPGKPEVSGPEGLKWVQPFQCHHVAAIPTGFTAGFTQALIWQIFSKLTTDPLA
jgi:hypothetical protein